jgi:hypothetical protein
MTEVDSKKQPITEFVQQHTLTEQDLQRLIQEKLERARAYYNAKRKREAVLDDR